MREKVKSVPRTVQNPVCSLPRILHELINDVHILRLLYGCDVNGCDWKLFMMSLLPGLKH